MKSRLLVLCAFLLIPSKTLCASDSQVFFIAELPSPNEYDIFANGGWNGNWYVGNNRCWVSKIGPVKDISSFEKVYLGAKLGRAKTPEQISSDTGVKSINDNLPIYIGISQSMDSRVFKKMLTYNRYIPLEGSEVSAVNGVASSRWFWAEIQKSQLSSEVDNYIYLFTDSDKLTSVKNAPVLAAGLGSEKENSYLLDFKEGKEEKKIIKFFEPAIALKLVKEEDSDISVEISKIKGHPYINNRYVVALDIDGRELTGYGFDIASAKDWHTVKSAAISAPYIYILDTSSYLPGKYRLRAWVENWSGFRKYSKVHIINIGSEKQ